MRKGREVTNVTLITPRPLLSDVMGRINIEIPDDLHTDLKVEAAEGDETLKGHVISVLRESVDDGSDGN